MLIVLTEGDLQWLPGGFREQSTTALPQQLFHYFSHEPLWVDLRWARETEQLSLRNSRFRAAILDIAATLLKQPKDFLDGDDVRVYRRNRVAAYLAITLSIALAGLACAGAFVANSERNRAVPEAERANRNADEAEHRSREAVSRELAANALLQIPFDPQLAILLALEAVRTATTTQAEEALRQSIQDVSPLTTIKAHTDLIRTIDFSGDSRKLITASDERTARLWEVPSGWILAALRGHTDAVLATTLSNDATLAITAGADHQARIWDASTERCISVLSGHHAVA